MTIPRWTPAQLEAAVGAGAPLLVDLRADWCTQCAPQERVLERVAPEYADTLRIASVDVGEHPQVADAYEVRSLPAFLLFAGGEHARTVVGFRRAPELRGAIASLLSEAPGRKDGDAQT